jgi:LruC domain-containing protein
MKCFPYFKGAFCMLAALVLVACEGRAPFASQEGKEKDTAGAAKMTDMVVPPNFDWSASTKLRLRVGLESVGPFGVQTQGQQLFLLDHRDRIIARTVVRGDTARFAAKLPTSVRFVSLFFPATRNVLRLDDLAPRDRVEMRLGYWPMGVAEGLDYKLKGLPAVRRPAAKAAKVAKVAQTVALNNSGFDGNDLPIIAAGLYETSVYQNDDLADLLGTWVGTGFESNQGNSWLPRLGGGVLGIGHPNMTEYSYVFQDIEMNPSAEIDFTFTAQVRQPSGNSQGSLQAAIFIIVSRPDGTQTTHGYTPIFEDPETQNYKDWTPVTAATQIGPGPCSVRVLISAAPGTKRFTIDDAVVLEVDSVLLTSGPSGQDPLTTTGSGGGSQVDEAAGEWATLVPYDGYTVNAFEDLWPRQGDYDMNDLVVSYRLSYIFAPEGQLDRMVGEIYIDALGATFPNGLGLCFLDARDDGSYVPWAHNFVVSASGVQVDPQVENGVIISQNVVDLLPQYYQNNGSGPEGDPVRIEFIIQFDAAQIPPLDRLEADFFLFRSERRGLEVHRAGMPATAAADIGLFGDGEDATAPSQGYWYKTDNGLPWAVEIVESFNHPLERVVITEAYPDFSGWATSGGQVETDWYQRPRNNKIWKR